MSHLFQSVVDVSGPGDPACANSDEIGGVVFLDYNDNGTKDTYEKTIHGVEVAIYDDNGQVGVSQTTADDGVYLFSGLSNGTSYRIEVQFPNWFFEGAEGADAAGDVQVAYPGSCDNNFGIYQSHKYCGVPDPTIGVTCFVEGAYNGPNAAEPALLGLPYSADGHDFVGTNPTGDFQGVKYASHGEIGATYGMAWQATHQRLYLGAYHKRFSGFGPGGPDAIYQFDQSGNLLDVLNLDILTGSVHTAGIDVHDFSGVEIMDLGTASASFDGVGKRAFGDLEMSSDGTTLFTVNLFDRMIYAINVADGIAANATLYDSWAAPDPTGAGRNRPFALAWHHDKLWLGTVDENADSAWVHSLDPAGSAFELEFAMGLNFTRQSVIGSANQAGRSADWRSWVGNPETTLYVAAGDEIFYPQPILTDIEFDGENMNLGFRDRFGDQTGMRKYFSKTDSLANKFTYGVSAGDIVRVCNVNGSFVLESGSGGSCAQSNGLQPSGPNGHEYFYWDIFHTGNTWNTGITTGAVQWETAQGALLQIGGEPSVLATVMDPFHDFSGGVAKFVNATGGRKGLGTSSPVEDLAGAYTIFESGDYNGGNPPDNGFFARANGLGDIAAFTLTPPLEIGNFIWNDFDSDGIQDPGEPGIDGVEVSLMKDNLIIATTTSAGGGKYGFSNAADGSVSGYVYGVSQLQPDMDYEIQIQHFTGQNPLSGLGLTAQNNGGVDANSDRRDSDAAFENGHAVISFTTGQAGENVHHFDIGFHFSLPPFIGLDQTICSGHAVSMVAYQDNLFPIDSIPGDWQVLVQTGSTAVPDMAFGDSLLTVVFTNNTNADVVDTVVFTNQSGLSDTMLVTVKPGTQTFISDEICSGTAYDFGGESIFAPGLYHDTLQAANGCDSVITLNLVLHFTYFSPTEATICEGESYFFQGNQYADPGIYRDSLVTVNGCDSIFQLTLSVLPNVFETTQASICEGEPYNFNGNLLETPGVYLDTLENIYGCDSVVELSLSVEDAFAIELNETICPGELYFFGGSNLGSDGTYYDTLTATNGCDSVLILHLTTLPHSYINITAVVCQDDGYVFNGQQLSASGTYVDTLMAANGCDSFITLSLTVLPVPETNAVVSICSGESYLFDGNLLTSPGIYFANLVAENGCDSVVTLNLSVRPSPNPVLNDVGICGNATITLNPGAGFQTYAWSTFENTPAITVGEGAYMVTVTNNQGCTASATAVVTDLGEYLINLDASICEGESYLFDGELRTVAGSYEATYLASNGCDSTVTLDLAVFSAVEQTLNESICEGGTFTVGGEVFSTAGTYVVNLLTANGCDSTVTLNLSLLPNFAVELHDTLCAGQSVEFNNQVLSVAGIYVAQHQATNSCDSTVTLHLTVLEEINTVLDQEICEGDSLFFNDQYLTDAGLYFDTLPSYQSCDSLVILSLTVNPLCNPVFDLALRKTLAAGQPDSVQVGDTITYTITIFNQGNVPAYNILVFDYLPAGLTFSASQNPGWFDFGAGPTWLHNSSPLLPDNSLSKNIQLVVNNQAGLGQLNNFAEISTADDDPFGNNTLMDIDSSPDAFEPNDPGGNPGTLSDDVITGDGTGAPNSNDPATDEDDHDGAGVTVYVPSVSLGNLVFADFGNDGIFNTGDEGLEDVQVILCEVGQDGLPGSVDDVNVDTILTNGFGEYLFSDLTEGLYFVKLSGTGIPLGFVSSTGDGIFDNDGAGQYEPSFGTDNNQDNQDDGSQLGNMIVSDTIRLALGEEPGGNINLTVDFGLYQPQSPLVSLGDFVWVDNNHNGQQDGNEPGVQGAILQLFDLGNNGIVDADDQLLALDTTDAEGHYAFENLDPGSYYVALDLTSIPANYNPTIQHFGDDTTDSNADSNGSTAVVVLSPGEDNWTIDIGIEPEPAALGDYVWNDENQNGTQDSTETGAAGITVQLFGPGQDGQQGGGDDVLFAQDTTDADGQYGFDGLEPGSYYVAIDLATLPNGFVPTLRYATGDNSNDSDIDLAGKTDLLSLAPGENNDAVDAGIYESMFDLALTKGLAPNQPTAVNINDDVSYKIEVINQGQAPAFNVLVYDHIPQGLILSPNDQQWTAVNDSTASFLLQGPLLAGDTFSIEIILQVQYGASGAVFTNVAEVQSAEDAAGNILPDLDSTPNNGSSGEDDLDDQPIELLPHDPTGWIYCDKTGGIITGGTISVTGPNGLPNDQVFIIHDGIDGYYEFYTDGTPGIYTLTYTHPDGYPLSASCLPQPDTLDPTGLADPLVLGADTLNNLLADTACNSNPYYLVFDLAAGDPIVLQNNLPLACIAIEGNVCEDVDLNDNYDGSEPAMANVTVHLYICADTLNPIQTQLTDSLGQYSFAGLLPGDYNVQIVLPNGYRFIQYSGVSADGFTGCTTLDFGDFDSIASVCMIPCAVLDAGAAVSICQGDTALLQATTSHGTGSFVWSPSSDLSDDQIANPLASPSTTTTYVVNFDDGLGCGSVSDSVTVFVSTTDPVLIYAPFSDTTIYCTDPVPFEAPQFADGCDTMLLITVDSVINAADCGGSIERTWTATNGGGNTVSFTQTVNFLDTVPPVMFAIHPYLGEIQDGDTLYVDCNQVASFDSTGFSSYDECCPAPTITFTETIYPGECATDGYRMLMNCGWTSTDCCGNVADLFFTVFVNDVTPPSLFGVPGSGSVDCSSVPLPAMITATDNCDASADVVFDEIIYTSVYGCDSLVVRTWSAVDSCGNLATATQHIDVMDNTPPQISANHVFFGNINHGDTLYADCSQIPSLDSIGFAAFDNCCATTVQFYENISSGNCALDGYMELRYCGWTATDCCGNTDSLFFTVIIDDNTPPIISGVPADQQTSCNAIPPVASVSATDDCFPTVSLSFGQNTLQTASGCDSVLVRTWTATDSCGNFSEATQYISVLDTTPPTMTANHATFGNINHGDTLYADCSLISSLDSMGFSAFDDCCATTVTFEETITPGTCANDGFLEMRHCGWTATDCCGNSDSLFFTVFVSDLMPPSFFGVPGSGSVDCSSIPLPTMVTATDNCDTLVDISLNETFIFDNSTGGCYLLQRTWTATDDCGNTTLASQMLTVSDSVAPILSTAPADTSVACITEIPPAAILSAIDECDTSVQIVLVETSTGDPSGCDYQLTRTWTATDDCGNIDVEVQVITVNDDVPPTLEPAPGPLTISCSLPIPVPAALTATDNCDADVEVSVSDSYIGDSATGCYLITRTWTAMDDCGNSDTVSQLIMVVDFTAPVLQNVPPSMTVSCDSLPEPNVTATDNCDPDVPVTMTETYTTLPNGCVTQIHRTFTATDDCNNFAFATQTLFVTSGNAPLITLNNSQLAGLGHGDTLVMECNNMVSMNLNDASASSNCCPDTDLEFQEFVVAAGNCATDGYMQVMHCGWIATDCCGNVDSLFLVVVIADFTPPALYGAPADLTLMCGASIPPAANVVAVDNCDNHADITYSQSSVAAGDGTQITRTWTATDFCGNVITSSQVITVLNDEPPMLLNVPADLTLIYPTPVPAPPVVTAIDDCDTDPTIVLSEVTAGNGCCFTLTRTWTVTDYFGNTVSDQQVITMLDTLPPALAGIPSDQTYDCSVVNVPVPVVTAADDCAANPILVFSADTTQLACGYQITRSWTATDQCNNSTSGSYTLTFLDTTNPVLIGVPADITISCNDPVPAPANVIASDNCDGNPDLAFNETPSGAGCIYTITRTWTALDNCGNSVSAMQTITVNSDLVLPQLVGLPSDITVDCGSVPPAATVTATDNCDLDVQIDFTETVSDNCPFQITRTWVATDDCGNSISGSQVITLVDNVAPSISNVPGNLTVQCDAIPPVPNNVSATDNCDEAPTLNFTETSEGSLCFYTITRTWSAQDNCGNVIVAEQQITVIDTEAPEITVVPENDTLECIDDIPITPTITAIDNCDTNVTVTLHEDYDVSNCLYTLTRTWIATDYCGNADTAIQVIVYDDTSPPVLSQLPADTTVSCDGVIAATFLTAVDNCDTFVEVFLDEEIIGSGCEYVIQWTWTAVDDCANSTTHVQKVTVVDMEAPQFEEPMDLSVHCSEIPPSEMPAVSENCDTALVFEFVETTIDLPCGSEILRTWTATDDCGNVDSVDQVITVLDTTAPTIVFSHPALQGLSDGDTLDIECASPLVFTLADASASDDCGVPNLTLTTGSTILGNCLSDGYIFLAEDVWTATDACGKQTQISIYKRLVDTEPPVFTFIPSDTIIECGNSVPVFGTPIADDGCQNATILTTTDSLPTNAGYDLVRTWMAIDNCGNSASASQTISIQLNGMPILTSVPSDTVILLSDGGLVPVAPNVLAEQGCTGEPLTVVFSEFISPDTNGCDTTIVRIWSATDTFGTTLADTQHILLVKEISVTTSTQPETCAGADGFALLAPATLNFNWSDGGTGAVRNDLVAGIYSVTAYDGGCIEVLEVVIDLDCNCVMPVIDSVSVTGATCGESDGSAVVHLAGDANDYTFVWIPDAGIAGSPDNARTDLPAGQYEVIVTYQGVANCADTTTFDIIDDCFKCPDLTIVNALVALDEGTGMTCVPVPFGTLPGLEIQVNGLIYTGALQGCDNQSVLAYDYSTAYGGAQNGAFEVQWQHDGTTFHTIVSSMDELAAGMTQASGTGLWINDKKSYRLITTNLAGNYGALTLKHLETSSQTVHGIYPANALMGTEMQLLLGINDIVFTNPLSDCNDAVTVTLEGEPEAIFSTENEVLSGACDQAEFGLCLDIPFSELGDFEFSVDGSPYNGFTACNTNSYHVYSFNSLPPAGPYQLSEWTVNGVIFSAIFNSVNDLAALMGIWDPQGNWSAVNGAISGGMQGSVYGKMVIHHGPQTFVINAELVETDGYLNFALPPGNHVIIAKRLSDNYVDTLNVMVSCVTTDQYQFTIVVGETGTMCFDLDELQGTVVSIENVCSEGNGAPAQFEIDEEEACAFFTGALEGESQGCFVLCDDLGICDTVLLTVEVALVNQTGEAEPAEGLEIFNAFSPNGDGINDFFTIKGLQKFKDHKLAIYSRDGHKVFAVKNYNNDWGGSWGSNSLPNGTYFYILELKNGERLTGYVQIER